MLRYKLASAVIYQSGSADSRYFTQTWTGAGDPDTTKLWHTTTNNGVQYTPLFCADVFLLFYVLC